MELEKEYIINGVTVRGCGDNVELGSDVSGAHASFNTVKHRDGSATTTVVIHEPAGTVAEVYVDWYDVNDIEEADDTKASDIPQRIKSVAPDVRRMAYGEHLADSWIDYDHSRSAYRRAVVDDVTAAGGVVEFSTLTAARQYVIDKGWLN